MDELENKPFDTILEQPRVKFYQEANDPVEIVNVGLCVPLCLSG